MRLFRPGNRQIPESASASDKAARQGGELAAARFDQPTDARDLGRRDLEFGYQRLFIPSLVIDQTELMLRRAGLDEEEGFGIWAGTLAGGDAFVSTLIIPSLTGHGRFHGEVGPETVARILERLDHLDLVPLAQIHSHPQAAFLSSIDAERPLIAALGFLSVVIPDFGFVDVANTKNWKTYEYRGVEEWNELSEPEQAQRIIIDPSLMRVN